MAKTQRHLGVLTEQQSQKHFKTGSEMDKTVTWSFLQYLLKTQTQIRNLQTMLESLVIL